MNSGAASLNLSGVSDAVTRFRRLTGRKGGKAIIRERPSVPPRERALVVLVLVNIAWLVFAMGGVKLWGELVALALSISTLLLLPRWNYGELSRSSSPVQSLLKLPLFWLGLGLYVYLFIESWNVAWQWQLIGGRPYFVPAEPRFDFLPKGIVAPFDENNPIRSMIFYTIPWISCCSVWVGLQTRRAVLWMLHGLAWIGLLFAAIALWQYFLHLDRILGLFPALPNREGAKIPFWGTLHNSNHAAYYLMLTTGACLGLFFYGWYRDLRRFKRSGGIWLIYLGLAIVATFAVLMAQARSAIIFVLVQWLLFILICTVFFVRRHGWFGLALPGAFLVIIISTSITFVINPDIFENQKQEWIKTFTLVENPELEARYYMLKITRDMVVDRPIYGHGAGSWRYLHLPYLDNYPEFKTSRIAWRNDPVTGNRERREITLWFQNAHVDLLEYLVEWGIVGCLFPVLAGFWLLYRGIRARSGWDPGLLTLLSTVGVVFLAAMVEFHFRIPLVLLAWCLLFVITIKLAEMNVPSSGPVSRNA